MVGREAYVAVFILVSRKYGTLYIGVTSQLARRMWEHREGVYRGFTKKYESNALSGASRTRA